MEAISCKKNRKDIRTVIKLATNRKTIKIQQGHLYIKSHERIKPVAETHNRTLRSSVNGALAVPRSRASLFDRSYSYTALKLWNSIPIPIH